MQCVHVNNESYESSMYVTNGNYTYVTVYNIVSLAFITMYSDVNGVIYHISVGTSNCLVQRIDYSQFINLTVD